MLKKSTSLDLKTKMITKIEQFIFCLLDNTVQISQNFDDTYMYEVNTLHSNFKFRSQKPIQITKIAFKLSKFHNSVEGWMRCINCWIFDFAMRQSLHVSLSEQLHQRTQCFVKHNDNTLGGGRLLQDRYSSNICRLSSDLRAQSHNQGPLDRLRWSADWRSRDNRSLAARKSVAVASPPINHISGGAFLPPGAHATPRAQHHASCLWRAHLSPIAVPERDIRQNRRCFWFGD